MSGSKGNFSEKIKRETGVVRDDAWLYRSSREKGADFKTELLADDEVTKALSPAEIEEKFDLGYHTKHVDAIFRRVFGA